MKNIIITGASKGIGRAIALHFAKNGYAIAACARTEKDIKALEAEVKALAPDMPHVLSTCDMSDREQIVAFAQQVRAAWDHVHILVNNAGTFLPGQVINEAEGTLEKLIETNLYSAYHTTRQFVGDMIRDRRGHIFNMCSVASIGAYHNGGSYSISKFALLGLSKALREELKPHAVKVTSLIPGATYTDSWSGAGIEESRFMKAEDIAQTVWDIYHLSKNTVVEEVLLRPVLGDI